MRRLESVLIVGLLLGVLVGCTTTATPVSTPVAEYYITFKEAYAKAQVAVVEWDEEGILTSAKALPKPESSGMSKTWLFDAMTPMRQSHIYVGQGITIGIAEKGEMVCVDGDWESVWWFVDDLDCVLPADVGLYERIDAASRCFQEAVDNGEVETSVCIDSEDLKKQAISIEEIGVDSTEAVSIARQHGWADAELDVMYLSEGMWTLGFSVTENNERTYQYVKVDARTGEMKP